MTKLDLNEIKSVHFIGIGGIGVSALARMMLERGKSVSGSDSSNSRITEELEKLGAMIFIGHNADNLPENTDLVIYTIAISPDNPEFVLAKKKEITTVSYPEFLGIISKDYFTIAVSGTHGKTTTTAMVSDVLRRAGVNPTVIVGSLFKGGGSNFIAGGGPTTVLGMEYKDGVLIVEACEYRRSFLNIHPHIAIITNIDNDHLDYYKNMDDIISAFHEFATKVPKDGFVIANMKDVNVVKALRGIKAKVTDYFQLEGFTSKLKLKVPGEHNRDNAQAVLALADILGLEKDKASTALIDFSGTWRRFELKGETKAGVLVYDDYAHHPTEIRATLAGAREKFPDKKIIVVFQPHLYSRTRLLLNDFAQAFNDADSVILAPIYAAREPFDESIKSEMLAEKINLRGKKALSMSDFKEIEEYLDKNLKSGDLLITMGAGDIHKVGEALV